MKPAILFCALLNIAGVLFQSDASAQPEVVWERTYDVGSGSTFTSLIESYFGGYIATSNYENEHRISMCAFVKLNPEGAVEWMYRPDGINELRDCISIIDGGYVGIGSFIPESGNPMLVVTKLSNEGIELWRKYFPLAQGWEIGFAVYELYSGELLVASSLERQVGADSSRYQADLTLRYLGSEGDHMWIRSYGTEADEVFDNISLTRDGGLIAVGYTWKGRGRELTLVKIDAEYELEWMRGQDFESAYTFKGVVETLDGGFSVTGNRFNQDHSISQTFLIHFNSVGEQVWEQWHGGLYGARIYDIAYTSDGRYVATGYIHPDPNTFNFWLTGLNPDGSAAWQVSLPTDANEYGMKVCLASDDGYLIARKSSILKMSFPESVAYGRGISTIGNLRIASAFPSPFNSSLTVEYEAGGVDPVRLSIHDVTGRTVKTWLESNPTAGRNRFVLDCLGMAAGCYSLRLQQSRTVASNWITLVK